MPDLSTKADIDRLAERHERIAQKLREASALISDGAAAGLLPEMPDNGTIKADNVPILANLTSQNLLPPVLLAPTGRQIQVYKHLKRHGPKSRGDLLVETNVPAGTIGKILSSPFFMKDDSGRWIAKEGAIK